MRTYHYRYLVRLSEEQRRWLETMLHTSRTPAKHYLVARVVLMSDQSQGEPEATDGQIAEILSLSRRTVIRIKQRFVQGSLEVALTGSFPRERPERRCLDVYCQPYDPAVPRICRDEMGKNLVKDKYPPERGLARTSGAGRLQLRKRRPRQPVHCL
jgi:hypothetical protein